MDERQFDYDGADDSEVYITLSSADLVQGLIRVSACTVAGDETKANEDAFAITVGENGLCMAVFDGTTSLRPLRAMEALGISGARFASHFLRDAFKLADDAPEAARRCAHSLGAKKLVVVAKLSDEQRVGLNFIDHPMLIRDAP